MIVPVRIRFLRADWNKLFAVVVCFQIAILAPCTDAAVSLVRVVHV